MAIVTVMFLVILVALVVATVAMMLTKCPMVRRGLGYIEA